MLIDFSSFIQISEMITVDSFRKLTLSFPEVTEEPHFSLIAAYCEVASKHLGDQIRTNY